MNPKALFLILIIALAADAITGFSSTVAQSPAIIGCNNPPSLEQCGTASCTPTTGIAAPYVCGITVTFNPTFAAVPKFVSAQIQGCHSPECHPESGSLPLGSISFQSDNGETWTNMPVAKTEIYGTINHETTIQMTRSMTDVEFIASCLTGSASATARLRPEYSIDSGATWHELANNAGFLDVAVDANTCGFALPPFSMGPTSMAVAIAGQGLAPLLRVVGINGNGVGDVPVFNNIQLVFFGVFSQVWYTCIPGSAGAFFCQGGTQVTASSMGIAVIRWAPGTSDSGSSILVNWIASE